MVDEDEVNAFKKKASRADIPQKGPHSSYGYNLMKVKEFLTKTERKLPEGLLVALRDTDGLKLGVLMFSCNHPKKGRWAYPVCLHQDGESFRNELYLVAEFYKELVATPAADGPRNALNVPRS